MEKLVQPAKTRLGADCDSDHELLITKFVLNLKNELKKVGKLTEIEESREKPLNHSGMTYIKSLMIMEWK